LGNWLKLWVPIIIVSLIISITVASTVSAQGKYSIPAWVKGVAGFWAEDKITDDEFGEGLSFLIDNEIIRIPLIEELKNENIQLKNENDELKTKNFALETEKFAEIIGLETTSTQFDPEIVKASKENIPGMQALPREILKQCKNVKSYSDYLTFSLAVSFVIDELVDTIEKINAALTTLELEGYDKHPEVGPLIKETRSLATETSECVDDVLRKYG